MNNILSSKLDMMRNLLRAKGAVIGYIFGSYARGKAGPLSDIDIAVVFPSNINKEIQGNLVEDIRGGLEKIFGRDKADVVNITEIKNPLLRYIIMLEEGIPLFVDDIFLKNKLVMQARRDYEDTRHLRTLQSQSLSGLFA